MLQTKYYYILIILFCCISVGFSQNRPVIDSLWSIYNTTPEINKKIDVLNELTHEYYNHNIDSSKIINKLSISLALKKGDKKKLLEAHAIEIYLLSRQGVYKEGLKKGAIYLEQSRNLGHKKIEADLLNSLGIFNKQRGNYKKAIELCEQGLTISKKKGYKLITGRILLSLGLIYTNQGDYEKALQFCEQSLIINRELGHKNNIAIILTSITQIYKNQGNYKEAINLYQQILTLRKELRDKRGIAITLNNLGNIYREKGNYKEAINLFKKSLTINNELDNKKGVAINLNNLGSIYGIQGNHKEAINLFKESLAIFEKLGRKGGMAYCLNRLGSTYYNQKNYDEAVKVYQQSLAIRKELGDKNGISSTLYNLANLDKVKGNCEKAIEKYKQGLFIRKELSSTGDFSSFYLGLSECYLRFDSLKIAESHALKTLNANNLNDRIKGTELLTAIHEKKESYKKALEYDKLKYSLSKTQIKQTNQAVIDSMLINMQSVRELDIQKLENEQKSQQIISRNYFIGIAILITLFLFVSLLSARKNSIKNKKLASQQQELAKKNKQIVDQEQEYRKTRDNLFANISHEFRTPLTVLKTSIEKTNDIANSKLLLKNTNHLIDLTNQMLDISKLSEKKINLNIKPIDVAGLTKQLLEQVQSFAESKNIQLKLKAPSSVVMISLDEKILRKIIINLVFNAIKFTQNGGLVKIIIEFKDTYWSLIVKDNGIGIDTKEIPYIFERYYRAPLHEDRASTGGLGLALTKQLVELVKGNIQVKSELKKGSEFCITFPNNSKVEISKNLKYANYNITPNNTLVNPIPENNITLTKPDVIHTENTPTVLLIEDNPDLNNVINSELTNHFKTISAFNGKEALKTLKKKRPDIIVTDIMMPVMNGIEFIETIKTIPEFKGIPIIVMSALEENHSHMKLWKLGVVDFITKPFDLQILLFKITNNLKTFQESTDQYKNLKSLTANLIHDLRSPVVTLKMIASDLIENKEEDLDKYLNYISENSNNLLDLINGLTEINRIHKRKSYTTFNIKDSFNNVLFNLSHLVEKTNAFINHEIQDFEVTMDKTDFSRILQNLMENALTYAKKDIPPKIDITILSKKKNAFSITVKDNGKGIPEKDFENIFKQLKRGKSSTGTQGSGLGLYIVKEIINKYHGNIEVSSTINESTTFSLNLNLKNIV
ncbi:Signal transduction histidine kinase [Tenacibaculum sp. MAR_2009_124]|uniref:tetratricopeptide repeat protein n=1 Tax=Tenacibaculum sp. MAR_2009_124 TaxID=1250059 RepID=UPI00089A98EF|nr:tetratricopeptide repeat protein [Tenacibaculum sp. MAR_2009_124]SEB72015.1 Signal transduction histidine kinase [Tenacibaculum sp. MAR_2009_124]